MYTHDVLHMLVSKLPLSVADGWIRKTLSFQRNSSRKPYLNDFISLFDEEIFRSMIQFFPEKLSVNMWESERRKVRKKEVKARDKKH